LVEAWRGEVCYWIMKGQHDGIYRCKVRDPSVFNWPALARAVVRKERDPNHPERGYYENILADFPLINKSFNLSYAGRDL
jgi:formate hydrogenlyase subunit 5